MVKNLILKIFIDILFNVKLITFKIYNLIKLKKINFIIRNWLNFIFKINNYKGENKYDRYKIFK